MDNVRLACVRVLIDPGAAIGLEAGKAHTRGKYLTLYTNSISIASFPHQSTLVAIPIVPLEGVSPMQRSPPTSRSNEMNIYRK